jgi:hypothetical protein
MTMVDYLELFLSVFASIWRTGMITLPLFHQPFSASLFFVRLARPFSPPPTEPSWFSPLVPAGLNFCGHSSQAFVSLTLGA